MGEATPNERYSDSLRRRLGGTCDWLFDKADFQSWLLNDIPTASPKLLWIHGHAGFGKTILCARAVEHLSSQTQHSVAHFFFSSDYASRGDPYVAFRSWLVQLVSTHTQAFEIVSAKLDDQETAPRQTIVFLLKAVLEAVRGCILVVDGLDECVALRDSSDLIGRFIEDLNNVLANDTRLLLVSRDEVEIRQALVTMSNLSEMRISPLDVSVDTEALSQNILDAKLPNKSTEVRQDLANRMKERCAGQFLWLTMQENSLRKGMTKKELDLAIDDTPSGLGFIYDRNWTRLIGLRPWDRNRAFSVLRWTTFSVRPLTVSQMAEALLIDQDCDEFPTDDIPDDMDAYLESEILGLCSPLIEVYQESPHQPTDDRMIQVAHFSVKQYLIAHLPVRDLGMNETLRLSNETKQHALLAQLCLRYIRTPSVWNGELAKSTGSYWACFRDYAANEWHTHIALGETAINSHTSDLVLEFMDERFPTWHDWRSYVDEAGAFPVVIGWETAPMEPLYYAVHRGLTAIASKIIEIQHGVKRYRSTKSRSTLHLASADGNVSLVKAILDAGVDVDIREHEGMAALHVAALHGRLEVAQMLIRRGANLGATSNSTAMPIHLAAVSGHLSLVQTFLDHGFDISSVETEPYADLGWTLAHIAADDNSVELLRLAVKHGANISSRSRDGPAPIHVATRYGHLETMLMLLEKGVDVNMPMRSGSTPLHMAAEQGDIQMTRMLIEKGANVNGGVLTGETPLGMAAREGHCEIAKMLLDEGADVTYRNPNGWTPLHLAACHGNAETVRLLLADSRVLINGKDNNGRTPLCLAADGGNYGTVDSLLSDSKIDISDHDYWGNTALIAAARNGHGDITALLLHTGVFDMREGFGHPLLWWLNRGTSPDVVRAFEEHAAGDKSWLSRFRVSPKAVSIRRSNLRCEICTLPVVSETHYRCGSCDGGDFDVCFTCYELGFRCRDASHGGDLHFQSLYP